MDLLSGALPSQTIRSLVEEGFIGGGNIANIGTDTYDPVITDDIYRLPFSFLPQHGEKIEKYVLKCGIKMKHGSVLEKNGCYIFRSVENVAKVIPSSIYGYANPKSNPGRIFTFPRLLADGVSKYDHIPIGYTGSLWCMIVPEAFPIIVPEGLSLGQIRFLTRKTRVDEVALKNLFNHDGGLLFDKDGNKISYNQVKESDDDGSVLLSLGLDFPIVGFEAVKTGEPIDLSKVDYYEPRDFFREIHHTNGALNFNPSSFYILSSEESLRLIPTVTCEMRPTDTRRGEFRVHYAGFIAPGWGYGPDGSGKGRPLTLEVRSYESGMTVRKGQPFAKIRFEMMVDAPEKHYDQQEKTKFKAQVGPALAKYFKSWK